MGTFVALIRGVGPLNPNMRNAKLAAVLAGLGCTDIVPVLASGNLVFRSTTRSTAQLETRIEKAFGDELGLSSDVIVRTQAELEAMVAEDPFKGFEHGKKWYLTVTFCKARRPAVLYDKLDRATMDGPTFMRALEKRHGTHITTRTWNTVLKIVEKMQTLA
jgi:uncharacterized protein (DUF1697 family)